MDKNTTERVCPVCDVVYLADLTRLRHGRQTTCSRRCSYALRAGKLENSVSLTCATCGAEFKRAVAAVKGKHGGQFCSRACHYAGRATGATKRVVTKPYAISPEAYEAWRIGAAKTVAKRRARDNYRHTDESRAKLSEATARTLAEGKVGRPSKLEDVVATQLKALGAEYVRQFAFRDGRGRFAFVCDFWFPAHNAVLEVNGTYWHVDPRAYPNGPINPTQERCLRKYARKVESLKALGIRLVEVWEADVKKNPTEAVFVAYSRLAAT